MTNKKFRDDLAKEMRDKYNERNKQLEQIEKLPLTEAVKESAKKDIMEAFYKEMENFKKRPGYEEAKKTHLEEIKARNAVKKAKKEYDGSLKRYENAQIVHRGKVEENPENDAEKFGELSQEKKAKLRGNKEAILKDLKENHVKIEEEVKMHGYRGKKVHIDLPAVGNFKGFKFDYFVSDGSIPMDDFESNSELKKKSYSRNDVLKLLNSMNQYMAEQGVETDGEMNYKKLGHPKSDIHECKAGDCLKDITGLNSSYWLSTKDVNVSLRKILYFKWSCDDDKCDFYKESFGRSYANLFLRLSD